MYTRPRYLLLSALAVAIGSCGLDELSGPSAPPSYTITVVGDSLGHIRLGGARRFSVHSEPALPEGGGYRVEWFVTEPELLRIDTLGGDSAQLVGLQIGETVVRVRVTAPDLTVPFESAPYPVEVDYAAIQLSSSVATLRSKGEETQLWVEGLDDSGHVRDTLSLAITSSDPTVVTISGQQARANRNGVVVLRAVRVSGELEDSISLVVEQVAKQVNLEGDSLALTSLNQDSVLGLVVTDSLGWSVDVPDVEWVSSAPAIVTVTSGGVIRGVTPNAGAVIRATVDGVTDSLAVVVRQTVSSYMVLSGGSQIDTVGQVLPLPIRVAARDAGGSGVPSVSMSFSRFNGSSAGLMPAAGTTDASGVVELSSWTLMTRVGTDSVQVTQTSGVTSAGPLTLRATAVNDRADAMHAATGLLTGSGTVGSPDDSLPEVVVEDQYGNPVPGETVTFGLLFGGGSITGGDATTDALGVARLGSWTLGTVTGLNRVTATVGALPTVTFDRNGTPAAPAALIVDAGQGEVVIAGDSTGVVPLFRVLDQFGNGVPGVSVTFAPSAGSVPQSTGTTAPDGRVGPGGRWFPGTVAGARRLIATAGALVDTVTATVVAGDPDTLRALTPLSGSGPVASIDDTLPTVRIADRYGNPKPGIPVTFTLTAGGGGITGGSVSTDAAGLATLGSWTLGTTAGPNIVTASAASLAPLQFTRDGLPLAPASIVADSGQSQVVVAGDSAGVVPLFRVLDQFGNGVPGVSVTFAPSAGSVPQSTGTTAPDGRVGPGGRWFPGTAAGTRRLVATSGALRDSVIATVTAASPDTTVFLDVPRDTITGALLTPVDVEVRDRFGNLTGFGGNVSVSIVDAGGMVIGIPGSFGVMAGRGSTAGVVVDSIGTGFRLQITAAEIAKPSLSGVFAVTSGIKSVVATPTAVGLNFIGDTQTVAVVAANPIKVVTGRPVSWNSSDPGVVTVSVSGQLTGRAPGSTTVIATVDAVADTIPVTVIQVVAGLTISPDSGVLQFIGDTVQASVVALDSGGSLVLGRVPQWETRASDVALVNAYGVIEAAGDGLARVVATLDGATDTAVVAVLREPATLHFTPDSIVLVSGSTVSAFTVEARDSMGIPIPSVGVPTGFVVPTLNGTDSIRNTLVASYSAGALVARAAGTTWWVSTRGTACDSARIVVLAGAPAVLAFVQGDSQTAVAGDSTVLAPQVLVRDSVGNPVAGVAVQFTPLIRGGVAVQLDTTDASGIAGAGRWFVATLVGQVQLVASIAGLADTIAATVVPAPAAELVLGSQPGQRIAGDTMPTIGVTAYDRFGNLQTGDNGDLCFDVVNAAGTAITAYQCDPMPSYGANIFLVSVSMVGGPYRLRYWSTTVPYRYSNSFMVVPGITNVSATAGQSSLNYLGDTTTIAVVAQNPYMSVVGEPVQWSVSATGVVALDTSSGLVSAIAPGSVQVIASVDGVADTLSVMVTQVAAGVTLTPSTIAMEYVGDTLRVAAQVLDSAGYPIAGALISWGSSDVAVATVSEGLITAVGPGVATISASSGPAAMNGTASVVGKRHLFTDAFSGDLSGWVTRGGGSWALAAGVLTGFYNISCGTPTCPQGQLLLSDANQPTGDWRADVRFAAAQYSASRYERDVAFVLYVSDAEKTIIELNAPATSVPMTGLRDSIWFTHQRYPWSQIAWGSQAVASYDLAGWSTASLEKVGNHYSLYFNGALIYEFDGAFSATPKIGFSVYGATKLDDFALTGFP